MPVGESRGGFEPSTWVGAALLVAGISYAVFVLATFRTGLLFAWLDNGIYRLVALVPALLALLPLSNGIRKRVPGCLRNSAIFLALTLIVPCVLVGVAVAVLVHGRGFSRRSAAGKLRTEFSLVKNCDEDAFDALPKRAIVVDLAAARAALAAGGYSASIPDASSCLAAKGGVESVLRGSGRIIVKTGDETLAGDVAADIFEKISPAISSD